MTVTATVTPSVSVSATATTICAGTSVTFTATPTNGGTTPAYQWQVNGANAGANSNTFISSSALANDYTVTVIMTSSDACASPSVTTSNAITVTVMPVVVPTFTQIGPLCQNSVAPVLPTTSTNGINGTWSPATINTASAGTTTYTFTPDAGQCASSTTMSIQINPLPLVDAPANVTSCSNYILPPLTNGAYYSSPGGVGPLAAGTVITSTQTIYVYAESGGTPNCIAENSFTVTIIPTPLADDPADVTACGSYTLPPLTNGAYYSSPGGVGPLAAGTVISSSKTVYVYAGSGPDCYTENSFTITILPLPLADDPADVTACTSYQLPALTNGGYFSSPGGVGAIAAGTFITSTKTIYVYAQSGGTPNCITENSFVVTITGTPPADDPLDVVTCGSYKLPPLTNGGYYSAPNGVGPVAAGTDITGSQTLYVYASNGPGCYTENSFDITILPAPVADDPADVTACGSYTLPPLTNGAYYSSPGGVGPLSAGTVITSTRTIYVYARVSASCFVENSFLVSVNPKPGTPTITSTQPNCFNPTGNLIITSPAGAGYSYSINGTDYSNTNGLFTNVPPGTYSITVKNLSGCISDPIQFVLTPDAATAPPALTLTQPSCTTATGTITVTSPSGAGYTYSIDGTNYSNSSGIFTGLAPGNYQVTAKSSLGCITLPAQATINPQPMLPTPAVTVTPINCAVRTATITISAPAAPDILYSIDGINYTNTSGIFSGLNPGTYHITAKNSSGCISKDTTVSILPLPVVDSSLVIETVCPGQLPYLWNGNSYTTAGTYKDTLMNAAGCDSVATLILNVKATTASTTNVSVCPGQLPYSWNGNSYTAAGTYKDTLMNAAGCDSVVTLILNVNATSSSVTNTTICSNDLPYRWNGMNITAAGTYTSTLVNAAGCDSVATLVLTVNTSPKVVINNPAPVCAPAAADLTAPAITAGSDPGLTFTYWMDSAATIPLLNPNAVSVSGIYYIKSSVVNNCSSTKPVEVKVIVIAKTPGVRYPTITADPNTSVQLTARNLGTRYVWSPPMGLNINTVKDPVFRYDRQTEYIIKITTDSGCTVYDTLLVKINVAQAAIDRYDLYVPGAFSPNGDGHNDKLMPLTINIRQLKYFRVFDRWGQLVFETNVIGQGWDGTYKGQKQVMDVYTWTVEAVGADGRTIKKSGNSVLIR
jgi:gliding motility-associated-like protein